MNIDALPTERLRRHATSDEYRKNGALWVEELVDKPVIPNFGPSIPYLDSNGDAWTVHEWADGQKFKRRAPLTIATHYLKCE